jgi:hypothetical protein
MLAAVSGSLLPLYSQIKPGLHFVLTGPGKSLIRKQGITYTAACPDVVIRAVPGKGKDMNNRIDFRPQGILAGRPVPRHDEMTGTLSNE